jgi:hypothetical protein
VLQLEVEFRGRAIGAHRLKRVNVDAFPVGPKVGPRKDLSHRSSTLCVVFQKMEHNPQGEICRVTVSF